MNPHRIPSPALTALTPARTRVGASMGGPRLCALRMRLARAARVEPGNGLPGEWIERALRDAESLAATTQFPELFLPALAEEKLAETRRWIERQNALRERTALAFAA